MGKEKPQTVWSYGGGVQTAAIAVLVHEGRLPKPGITVIADTGREASSTWEYLKSVMQPYLNEVAVTVEIAPHSLAAVDLYAKNGDLLIPAFTETGKLDTYCSNEWKQRVVHRYLRSRGVRQCTLWLGISTDELQRAKDSSVGWIKHHYPLLFDHPMSRPQAFKIVTSAGLPEPPRSSCWMCPHRSNTEWKALSPHDLGLAKQLEQQIRERDDGLYLHRSKKLLIDEPFNYSDGQIDFCDGGGFCWTKTAPGIR